MHDQLTAWSGRTGIHVEIWALPETALPPAVHRLVAEVLRRTEQAPDVRVLSIAVTANGSAVRATFSHDGSGDTGLEHVSGDWGVMRARTVAGAGTTYSAVIETSRDSRPRMM